MSYIRYKNKIKVLIGALAVTSLVLAPFDVSLVGADTNTDLQNQKTAKQKQLDDLNRQIQSLQSQIATTQKQQASLSNEIKLYNIEIQSTQVQIQATQTNMDNTNLEIQETKNQIKDKTDQIAQEKQLLAQFIQTLNEYNNISDLQLGLSTNNFSDFMDQVEYTKSVQNKIYTLLQQIKDLKTKLEQDQTALQQSLDKLNQLNTQLNETNQTLNDQKSAKTQLLAQTHGQETQYKKLLSTTQSAEDAVNKEIYDLDQQIQGKKGFNSLKPNHGIIAWPIDGVITQGYGNTGFTSLGYSFHNGLDIAAPAGTSIYAAADGVVFATGTGQTAYGNWVAIKHTLAQLGGRQIITLYGHMMSFKVKAGQTVKQGDLIGYEGNTGNTTRLLYGPDHGYHLHFSVFDADGFGIAAGAYQKTYGPYQVPYGYTYDPRNFL